MAAIWTDAETQSAIAPVVIGSESLVVGNTADVGSSFDVSGSLLYTLPTPGGRWCAASPPS